MMLLLCIFVLGLIIGTFQWFTEHNKPPTIDINQDDNINLLDNNLELLEIELDTLHEIDNSIDRLLKQCDNEKERISLLNKKATTINKIKRLEKDLEKLL